MQVQQVERSLLELHLAVQEAGISLKRGVETKLQPVYNKIAKRTAKHEDKLIKKQVWVQREYDTIIMLKLTAGRCTSGN